MGLLVFQTCLLHTPPFTHVLPVSRVCDGTFQNSHCGSVLAIFKHSSHSLSLSFPQNRRSMVLFPLSMSLGRKFSKLLDQLKVSPRSRSLFLEGVSSLHADSAPSDVPLQADQFQLASPSPCFQNLLLKLNTIASFYSIVCSKVRWAALVFFSVFLATFLLKKTYPGHLNPRKFHQAGSQAEKQQSSQLVPTSHSALFVHGDANKPCPSYSVLFVGNERTPQTSSFSPKVHGTYQPAKREEVQRVHKSGKEGRSLELTEWLEGVKDDARQQGVSEQVLESTLQNVELSLPTIQLSRNAPEVKLSLDAYLKRMVDEGRILSGVTAFQDNSLLLANIFEEYGVPAPILVSIWGIETSYGAYTGKWDVIQALVTLGFTSEQATRREYFREQLVEAMLMLEAGHGPSGNRQLLGSWAGAMGQCQFMPSSFRQYAVDYDGDGHTDIWDSQADVLASMANYLKNHGWKNGGPLFQKVSLAKKVDKSLLGVGVKKTVADWQSKHGVCTDADSKTPLSLDEMTSLVHLGRLFQTAQEGMAFWYATISW
ncbi:hypothetical protein BDL97_15G063300 [Sphagnum fallax]|nr:hypothetical protein BDL97_15G063300 [Sphagnum fallax]KAH8939952.1 hypothetical protein BDL97_15G063300 [Sphagnum fallax]